MTIQPLFHTHIQTTTVAHPYPHSNYYKHMAIQSLFHIQINKITDQVLKGKKRGCEYIDKYLAYPPKAFRLEVEALSYWYKYLPKLN